MTKEHMKQGSTVVNKMQPAKSRVFSFRHASCTAFTSAWAARSISDRTDSMPSPITRPSRTTTEPTGVSPRSRAVRANRIACRMNFRSLMAASCDLVPFPCSFIDSSLRSSIFFPREIYAFEVIDPGASGAIWCAKPHPTQVTSGVALWYIFRNDSASLWVPCSHMERTARPDGSRVSFVLAYSLIGAMSCDTTFWLILTISNA